MPRFIKKRTTENIGLKIGILFILLLAFAAPHAARAAVTEAQVAGAIEQYSKLYTVAERASFLNTLDPELRTAATTRMGDALEQANMLRSNEQAYLNYVSGLSEPMQVVVRDGVISYNAYMQQLRQAVGQRGVDQMGTTNPGSTSILNAGPNSLGTTNAVAQQQRDQGASCSFSPDTWDLCLTNIVYVFTVGLGSSIAFVGAYFFDVTVSLALNSAAYAQSFLSTGWQTARDLANMGFILALVFIAYTIILRAETAGTTKMLAWVIIMALIINFSFFFTRLIIDAGNILAVQFYNAIPTQQTLQQTITGGSAAGQNAAGAINWISDGTLARTKDLTHPIMNGLNMEGLFDTKAFDQWYKSVKGPNGGGMMAALITLSFLYIMVGAMYFILAVMFFAAGVKFMFRIVVLWFLIIVSPLAFLSKTTTITEKYYDLWQKKLIMHVFYPVVFLFIFLFISLVMLNLNPNGQGGLVGALFTDLNQLGNQPTMAIVAASIANVAIRLGFVVAMLYIAMKAADTVGVYGANAAKTLTSRVRGAALTTLRWGGRSTAGFAYQQTIGHGAAALSNTLTTAKWANQGRGNLGGWIGYRAKKRIDAVADRSVLGARSYNKYRKDKDAELSTRGANLSKVQMGEQAKENAQRSITLESYKLDESDKRLGEIQKKLKAYDDMINAGGGAALTQDEHQDRSNLVEEQKRIDAHIQNVTTREGKSLGELQSERAVVSSRVGNMSNAEVTTLKASDIEGIIKQISESHLKAIKESGKYSTDAVKEITSKWFEENKKSALNKSRDEIEKLEKIHSTLKDKMGITVSSIKERAASTPSGDHVITLKTTQDTKEELEHLRETEVANREGLSGQDRKFSQMKINELDKAIKKVDAVAENLAKIPEKTGGRDAPAEFIIKKS